MTKVRVIRTGQNQQMFVHTFLSLDIHVNRPHRGQNEVAKRLRALLCSEKYTSDIKCMLQESCNVYMQTCVLAQLHTESFSHVES